MNNSKKAASYGLILAFGMILSYVEVLVPLDFIAYGVKLGLANMITVYLLYKKDFKTALFINVLRILLVSLLFGNVMSLVYSLSGGLLSAAVMLAVKKIGIFSPVGVSVAGGVVHNLGQLSAAALILGSYAVFYYTPVLVIAGVVCGFLIGFISAIILEKVKLPFEL